MTRHVFATSLATLALTLAAGGCQKESKEASEAPQSARPPLPATASAPLASDLAKYTEGLEGEGTLMTRITTNQGVIHCELFEKGAPLTVANFVGLARGLHPFKNPKSGQVEQRPFYDGLIFHRVIPKFMIQGGDPLGMGSGGPGYKFANEVSDALKHDRPGIMSMANSGPNTNGSQFFITELAKSYLDGGYNVFGECMEIDVVGKIARVDKRGSKPSTPVVMEKVEIFRDDIKKYPKKDFTEPKPVPPTGG
jgi:peptidyl-prolyl cis-trans isomerase A (cyclophilin A)